MDKVKRKREREAIDTGLTADGGNHYIKMTWRAIILAFPLQTAHEMVTQGRAKFVRFVPDRVTGGPQGLYRVHLGFSFDLDQWIRSKAAEDFSEGAGPGDEFHRRSNDSSVFQEDPSLMSPRKRRNFYFDAPEEGTKVFKELEGSCSFDANSGIRCTIREP